MKKKHLFVIPTIFALFAFINFAQANSSTSLDVEIKNSKDYTVFVSAPKISGISASELSFNGCDTEQNDNKVMIVPPESSSCHVVMNSDNDKDSSTAVVIAGYKEEADAAQLSDNYEFSFNMGIDGKDCTGTGHSSKARKYRFQVSDKDNITAKDDDSHGEWNSTCSDQSKNPPSTKLTLIY